MNVRLPVALVALALLGPGPAHAEMVDFSYAVSISPQPLYSLQSVIPPGTRTVLLGSTLGAGFSGFEWRFAAPPDASSPVYVNTTSDVKVSLTDLTSGRSGQLDFGVHFQGLVGDGIYAPPSMSYTPTALQTMQLGDHLYHILPFVPAEVTGVSPLMSNPEGLAFQITVTPAGVVNAPEPSSLALGAMAAVGLAWTRRRRGRRGFGGNFAAGEYQTDP